MGLFDSLGAILALVIAGLVSTLAFVLKMWGRDRDKKREAEISAAQAWSLAEARIRAQKKLDEQAAAAQVREAAIVDEARDGRRDHFESDR